MEARPARYRVVPPVENDLHRPFGVGCPSLFAFLRRKEETLSKWRMNNDQWI
jgi:hypothetical protein